VKEGEESFAWYGGGSGLGTMGLQKKKSKTSEEKKKPSRRELPQTWHPQVAGKVFKLTRPTSYLCTYPAFLNHPLLQ
jgi:hypothetical protein